VSGLRKFLKTGAEPKFDDCLNCRRFSARNGEQELSSTCHDCDVGEHFEPKDHPACVDDFIRGQE
jgi:hypothetical protein